MYNTILNVEMINLEKIKSEKSQPPPPFKIFKGGGGGGGGGVQTMCNHTETLLSRIKTPQT